MALNITTELNETDHVLIKNMSDAMSALIPYTDEQAQDAIASLLQNSTSITWSYNDVANTLTATVTLAPFNTSDLEEGTNKYFTDERAQDAVATIMSGSNGVTVTYNDSANTIAISGATLSFNNSPGRSIVTGTGATGFQVSTTRNALVNYSVTITTAVQIGVVTNVDGYVVLEIAPTNSATAGDWIEIARTPQAQNVGLALAFSSTQKGGGNLTGIVPAGYYSKVRSVNAAGTPTYAMNSGQEVLL